MLNAKPSGPTILPPPGAAGSASFTVNLRAMGNGSLGIKVTRSRADHTARPGTAGVTVMTPVAS